MHNKGLYHNRLEREPLEKAFAEAWEKLNPAKERGLLVGLLKNRSFSRDKEVAATIIQWLGSSVGQDFIKSVQRKGR